MEDVYNGGAYAHVRAGGIWEIVFLNMLSFQKQTQFFLMTSPVVLLAIFVYTSHSICEP